jgi:hypothetical protein
MKTNDPWAKMDELISDEFIPENKGWFTAADFIERYKMPERTVRDKLANWAKEGRVEKRIGKTKFCKKPQNYFRLLD